MPLFQFLKDILSLPLGTILQKQSLSSQPLQRELSDLGSFSLLTDALSIKLRTSYHCALPDSSSRLFAQRTYKMPDLFRRLTVSGQVRHWGPLQCGTVPAETLCGRWVVPSAARSCIGTAGYQHKEHPGQNAEYPSSLHPSHASGLGYAPHGHSTAVRHRSASIGGSHVETKPVQGLLPIILQKFRKCRLADIELPRCMGKISAFYNSGKIF